MIIDRDNTLEFIKILNDIVRSYDRLTPTKIHYLRPSQIFVFGTDRRGSQKYGAAGLAAKSFGAQVGVSNGLTGNSYALPTKGVSLKELKECVCEFEKFAREHSELKFLVTAIGCGHAGMDVAQVSDMFIGCVALKNVYLPHEFMLQYRQFCNTKLNIGKQIVPQEDNVLDNFSDELHPIVNYMLEHSIPFEHDGGFFLRNESGKVLAEAELGIEAEKVVFLPLTEQDHQKFVSAGYKIISPENYILK